jgi:hypothetical protein
MTISQISSVSRDIRIDGYVLDASAIDRIDNVSSQALQSTSKAKHSKVVRQFRASTSDERTLTFDSKADLLSTLDAESQVIRSVFLRYESTPSNSIAMLFQSRGRIELRAKSPSPDFSFQIDRLENEIQSCDQHFSAFTKSFLYQPNLRSALFGLSILCSLILIVVIGFYIYSRNVGVNLTDASIIPSGNQYYQWVEKAIKSDTLRTKVDVLLMGQLKGFSNLNDVLHKMEISIAILSVALIILIAILMLRRYMRRLYPRTFFSFGHAKSTLARNVRRREIITIVIVLGFIVNVAAGLVIAFVL